MARNHLFRFFLERCGSKRFQSLIKNRRDPFARYWRIILSIPGHIQSVAESLTRVLAENVFLM